MDAASNPELARRTRLLLVLLVAEIGSTAVHYGDNWLEIGDYPGSDKLPGAASVPIAWVLLTIVGLIGYHLYRTEFSRRAHILLMVYSATGISSLAHFIYGAPAHTVQIVSVAIDGLTGLAMLAFAIWSYATPLESRARGRAVAAG
jgi:hypothetical protein